MCDVCHCDGGGSNEVTCSHAGSLRGEAQWLAPMKCMGSATVYQAHALSTIQAHALSTITIIEWGREGERKFMCNLSV